MEQLILQLPTRPLFSFDNLVLHEGNESAVSTITSVYLQKDKGLPNLFLYGPAGAGKTHVLTALANALKQRMSVLFISGRHKSPNYDTINSDVVVNDVKIIMEHDLPIAVTIIDDVHEIADQYAASLWNVSNKLTTAGLPLILSSLVSPQELFEHNLHLRSRVTSGLVLRLDNPGDSVRILLLDKLARDRNLRLPPEVVRYLVNHKARGLHDLAGILERLDFQALSKGRRVTLPFIRELEKGGLL